MRAAFVLGDVLADEHAQRALQSLDEAGLTPVVLFPHPAGDAGRPDTAGFPAVACSSEDVACWGEEPTLVLDAARRAGATPSQAFMVCAQLADIKRASEAGCRPVLILGGRTLDEVFGPSEPPTKAAICAPDLETAVRYMAEEAGHNSVVGPFPFAHGSTMDELALAAAPSRRDVQRVMAVVVVAGVIVSLGIAYLLQEIYQVVHLPPIFYYLTLQFIPQTLRGALFLGVGAVIVLFALFGTNRLPRRRG